MNLDPHPAMNQLDPSSTPGRLDSLDQFRGYTVLGMFAVNFLGSFAAIRESLPLLAHHHTYCSFADTIMPQFLFAVGFSFRLTYLRRVATHGQTSAAVHALRRNLSLLFVAFIVYAVGRRWENWNDPSQLLEILAKWAKQDMLQTLGHIAVASIWVLPVIGCKPGLRIAFALASVILHFGLSYAFFYRWTNTAPNGVDGGPLGFLTWTIPLLVGSLAHDAWQARSGTWKLAASGLLVAIVAYAASCLHLAPADLDEWHFELKFAFVQPPLVHIDAKPPTNDLFTMSQRSGSFTYPLFGAGWSLVLFAVAIWLCDRCGLSLGVFRTLGNNALAGYILHGLVDAAVKPFVPKNAPLWYVFVGLAVYGAVCLVAMRGLERRKLILKL